MAKCTQCLHGAILFVVPHANGEISVTLNTENLLEGDYLTGEWNGERWMVSTRKGKDL